MRLAGRGGIARALYVAATEPRVVVVRVFVKNTRRTPRREIEVALRREGGIAMTTVAELHERWSRDAGYREAYERLEPELEVARALVEARTRGVNQVELAVRMETTQSAVARMESGRVPPSMRTLAKVARATGSRLRISFEQGSIGFRGKDLPE